MNLHFPNHETLKLALTSGIIPESVGLAPVDAAFGDDGEIWIKTEKRLTKPVKTELKRLGVATPRSIPVQLDHRLSCWQQILPLSRETEAIEVTGKNPVLFEFYQDEQLPELVSEMLRLGNDRQGFRHLDNGSSEKGGVDARTLLRVIGPPYYSLLRALDRGNENTPRAYVEQSPRVWVEIGHRHELADKIKPPAGKLLLLRPPRDWVLVDEAHFRDIYKILDFQLPDSQVAWKDTELDQRINVPLRLAAGGTSEAAELWVLRENGSEQVEQLVRRSDNLLLSRLAFAVGKTGDGADGQTTIVIRVRPSKKAPPVLVLDGVAFRSYLKLPNLFLPVGQRLHPPLRRDAVGSLLSKNKNDITWLYPNSESADNNSNADQFTPETLPDAAFRPLSDWIDYVFDQEHEALNAWVASHRFDFEPYICKDDKPAKPKAPPKRRPNRRNDEDDDERTETLTKHKSKSGSGSESDSEEPPEEDFVAQAVSKKKPSQLQKRLLELEASFRSSDSQIDSEERREIWSEMAMINAALKHRHDATICWSNALWEESSPTDKSMETWLKSEKRNAPRVKFGEDDLDRLAKDNAAQPADASVFAAYLNWASSTESPPEELISRLSIVSRFLERQESYLPIRTAWMAWTAVTELAGGDVLALARARDRLLERLFQHGMRPELDMPSFLRSGGGSESERFRVLRDHVAKLRDKVNKWIVEPPYGDNPQTKIYGDMIFGFALARLGETTEVHKLLATCEKAVKKKDAVHRWILEAYSQRAKQSLEGETGLGRLNEDLLKQLDSMERLDRYKINRLRNYSRILEPTERIDPYRRWHKRYSDELSQELAELFDENDRDELRGKIKNLVGQIERDKSPSPKHVRILTTALELSVRLGESFADELLGHMEQVLSGADDVVERALLLEKGLLVAAHYDKPDYVQAFISHFENEMAQIVTTYLSLNIQHNPENKEKIDTIDSLFSQSLRGMRKLGMREEIGRLFGRLNELVHKEMDRKSGKRGGKVDHVRSHKLLLNAAGSWFYFGQNEEAIRIVNEVRDRLFEGDLSPIDQRTLVCSYINSVGQADLEVALPRIEELFAKSKGKPKLARIEDNMSTSSHFSISQLDVIETVVLTLVSDDFSLDAESRRWLDEDEFLVRRRIHRDVREAMEVS